MNTLSYTDKTLAQALPSGILVLNKQTKIIWWDTKAKKLLSKIEDGLEIKTKNDNELFLSYSEVAVKRLKEDAVSRSIETIRRRIDETGTREPTIQKQGEDRILIQLPGVDGVRQAKAAAAGAQ